MGSLGLFAAADPANVSTFADVQVDGTAAGVTTSIDSAAPGGARVSVDVTNLRGGLDFIGTNLVSSVGQNTLILDDSQSPDGSTYSLDSSVRLDSLQIARNGELLPWRIYFAFATQLTL